MIEISKDNEKRVTYENQPDVNRTLFKNTGISQSEIAEFINKVNSITGVPSGGSSGQVLGKLSGTDFDIGWINSSGGSDSNIFPVEITLGSTSGFTPTFEEIKTVINNKTVIAFIKRGNAVYLGHITSVGTNSINFQYQVYINAVTGNIQGKIHTYDILINSSGTILEMQTISDLPLPLPYLLKLYDNWSDAYSDTPSSNLSVVSDYSDITDYINISDVGKYAKLVFGNKSGYCEYYNLVSTEVTNDGDNEVGKLIFQTISTRTNTPMLKQVTIQSTLYTYDYLEDANVTYSASAI